MVWKREGIDFIDGNGVIPNDLQTKGNALGKSD